MTFKRVIGKRINGQSYVTVQDEFSTWNFCSAMPENKQGVEDETGEFDPDWIAKRMVV